MPPSPLQRLRCGHSPARGPAGLLGDSLSFVPLFKEFFPRFCIGRRHRRHFLPSPLSAKKVLDDLPFPSGAPAPWPRHLGPARTLRAERTD